MSEVAVEVATLTETMEVYGLDFSPDGKHLAATATLDGIEVHVWDWQGSESIVRKMNKGRGALGIMSDPLKYSPDGHFLAACHSRAGATGSVVVHIWDAETGEIAHSIAEDSGACLGIGYTPDGQTLIRLEQVGPRGGESIIGYNLSKRLPDWGLRTKPFHPSTLAISADGRLAAVGGRILGPEIPIQPQILIVDLLKHAIIRTIDAFPIENKVDSLAWHPDGIHVAAGARVGGSAKGPDIVKIFDVTTGKLIVSEPAERPSQVFALRYSPDGKYLVESAVNSSIRIWDGRHQTLLQEIHGVATSLAFSRDGRFLAMGGDRKILIWKMK